jgi:phospholipase C
MNPLPSSASRITSVSDYFDGNTVTALWNYAQHFAMNDNFHSSVIGPS